MYRPWNSTGLVHDLTEALAAVALVTFCLASGWPAIIGALLAAPGVPIVKAVIHRRAKKPWLATIGDGIWELLIWSSGWLVVYQGAGVDALGSLVLLWVALFFLRHYTKLGAVAQP